MRERPAFTLVETVVTIFILGTITGIFASAIYVSRAFGRADQVMAVDVFLSEAMDILEHVRSGGLPLKDGGDVIGLAYGVGIPRAVEVPNPPGGTHALEMAPVDRPLESGISSLLLFRERRDDIVFSADMRVDPASGTGWEAGLVFAYADADNYHRAVLRDGQFALERVRGGVVGLLDTSPSSVVPGEWFTVEVAKSGTQIDAELEGQPVLSASDPLAMHGHAGVAGTGEATSLLIDDLVVASPDAFSDGFEAGIPDVFLMNAPYHLPEFRPSMTVSGFEGFPDLLEVRMAATWSVEGKEKERELKTIMFIE